MKARSLFIILILYAGFFAASVGKLIAYFYLKPGFYVSMSAILPLIIAIISSRLLPVSLVKKGSVYLPSVVLFIISSVFLNFLYFTRPYSMYFSLMGEICLAVFMVAISILLRDLWHAETSPESKTGRDKIRVISALVFFFAGFLLSVALHLALIEKVTMIFPFVIIIAILVFKSLTLKSAGKTAGFFLAFFLSAGIAGFAGFRLPAFRVFPEQKSYEDKLVFHARTGLHDLSLVQWKNYYWLFMDGLKYLSSADDYLFYEPFIHPATNLCPFPERVLVLGGENGCAVRELLKYNSVREIDIVPSDTSYYNIACSTQNGHCRRGKCQERH